MNTEKKRHNVVPSEYSLETEFHRSVNYSSPESRGRGNMNYIKTFRNQVLDKTINIFKRGRVIKLT